MPGRQFEGKAGLTFCSGAGKGPMLKDEDKFKTIQVYSKRTTKIALAGRVLLVDNRCDMRVATGLLLSSLGLQVTTAETGQDALETAILADDVGYEFHLILMKIDMPIMDGLEATVLFRYAEYDGPIIAVAGRPVDCLEQLCADAGCNGVLVEPVNADRLHNILRRHLNVVTLGDECAA